MNVKIITTVIFVLIILGALGFFFMNSHNTKYLAERISPTVTTTVPEGKTASTMQTIQSGDKRISFQVPESWKVKETTVSGMKGKFGVITQSWVLQNFPNDTAGQSGIPDDTAKIDVEIQKGGQNLPIESLVDCGMKTTSCEKVGIANEQFIRSEATLNTGMKNVVIATFYDDKILRFSAIVAPGNQQDSLLQTVNTIFQSITFSDLPQS